MSALENRVKKVEEEVEAIKTLLPKVLNPEGKMDLNLTISELAVNISGRNETRDLDTASNFGKVIACAIVDLEGKPFTEAEMSACLQERSWGMAHGTLSPVLSNLTKERLLIKDDSKPMRYRLPKKVSFATHGIERLKVNVRGE